jgi:hypothetical protein
MKSVDAFGRKWMRLLSEAERFATGVIASHPFDVELNNYLTVLSTYGFRRPECGCRPAIVRNGVIVDAPSTKVRQQYTKRG